MKLVKSLSAISIALLTFTAHQAQAAVLPEAQIAAKITLAKKPTSKPMSIAYVPFYQRYYVADGGLAPTPGDNDAPVSKSQIHVYSAEGQYLQSAKPGFDNRSIYFNQASKQLIK